MKININKSAIKAVAVVLLFLLLILQILYFVQSWESSRLTSSAGVSTSPTGDNNVGLTYYEGEWYAPREDLETFLLMGLDVMGGTGLTESYTNDQQADFLLLLLLNHAEQTFSAIHLNRDTMTEIQILGVTGELAGSFTGQLALAHTYGDGGKNSCENVAQAVSNLLYGVEINHYLSLTMDAVPLLNDLVGGVTITVLDDFSNVNPTLVQGETVTLRGQQALTYVRTRLGLKDSSNLHRMERQRQYMTALLEQIESISAGDTAFFGEAALTLSEYLVSDCTVDQLSDLGTYVQSYQFTGIQALEGDAVISNEYMEFYVDEESLIRLVMKLFYEPKP